MQSLQLKVVLRHQLHKKAFLLWESGWGLASLDKKNLIVRMLFNEKITGIKRRFKCLKCFLFLSWVDLLMSFVQVTAKFKCVARVVASFPWRAEDFRSPSGIYRIRFTLEDPTARIHAYVYGEDGVRAATRFVVFNLSVRCPFSNSFTKTSCPSFLILFLLISLGHDSKFDMHLW